jgi:hypothetical protein
MPVNLTKIRNYDADPTPTLPINPGGLPTEIDKPLDIPDG